MATQDAPINAGEAGSALGKEAAMDRLNRLFFRNNPAKQATLLDDLAPSFENGITPLEEFTEMRKYGRGVEKQLAGNVLRFLELGLPWTYGLYGYFDQSVVEILAIAEKTGNLAQAMHNAARQMEVSSSIWGSVLKSVTYPLAILVAITVIMATLSAKGGTFTVMATLTPISQWPSDVLMMWDWGNFASTYWWLVILIVGGIITGVWLTLTHYEGPVRLGSGGAWLVPPREDLDRWPLFKMYRSLQAATFTARVGLLITNGVALRTALETLTGNVNLPREVKHRERAGVSRYLAMHIGRMLGRMATRATRYYEIFDTGLYDPELLSRIRLMERRKDAQEAIAALSSTIRTKVLRRFSLAMPLIQHLMMIGAGLYMMWFIRVIFALQNLAQGHM